MINLFQFSARDQSLCYLQKIFGSMNGVIPSPPGGCAATPVGTLSLLGAMFQTFNTVILAVGALIVIYATIVGVMATAHEGKFMGEKWNGLWTPLRMVIGIATLVPTGTGYSTIQIIMMWVIVQGIGAADVLWGTALGAISVLGSPYAKPTVPGIGVNSNLTVLFQALVCDATAKETRADPTGTKGGGYYCNESGGGSFCSSTPTIDTQQTKLLLGPAGACGVLTYCNPTAECATDPNSLKCTSCKAQVASLTKIVPTLANAAKIFEQTDYSYRDFYTHSYNEENNSSWAWIKDYCTANKINPKECCVKSTSPLAANQTCESQGTGIFPDLNESSNSSQNASDTAVKNLYFPYGFKPVVGGDFIKTATAEYMSGINTAINTYIAMKGQQGTLGGDLDQARINGWILAGSYYYVLGKTNQSSLNDAAPSTEIAPINISSGSMSAVRNNYNAAGVLISAANNAGTSTGTGGGGAGGDSAPQKGSSAPQVGESMDKMSAAMQDVSGSFKSPDQSENINPILQLQIAGFTMLMVAQVIFLVLIIATFLLGILGNLSIFGLGTGFVNPVGPAAILVYFVFIPLVFALLGFLVSIGGLLGIYIPLIPFVVFTTGVIGWFLATVEAMVAGPLVALGILSPSAQGHELLGKAEPALGLIFNIFLRPSLMIFGLMAAMLLANVVISLINWAFWNPVFAGVMGLGGTKAGAIAASVFNPLAFVIFLTAYVAFVLAALNKCFSAIHVIPSQVMSWISIQGSPGGAGGAEAELGAVKGATDKAAATAGGGMAGGHQQVGQAGHGIGKERKEKQEKKKGANLSGTSGSS